MEIVHGKAECSQSTATLPLVLLPLIRALLTRATLYEEGSGRKITVSHSNSTWMVRMHDLRRRLCSVRLRVF